jgi:hypothetical protein
VKARDGGDGSLVKSHPQHLQLLQIQILKDLHHYQSLMSAEASSEQQKTSTVTMTNLLKAVLVDLPDQWDALQTLVQVHCDAHSKHTCLCSQDTEKTGEVKGESCVDYFREELLAMQDKHPSARGTFLAEMYFLQEIRRVHTEGEREMPIEWLNRSDSEDDFNSALSELRVTDKEHCMSQATPFQKEMLRLLMQYITKFETKQCCFTDVKPYLKTLLTLHTGGMEGQVASSPTVTLAARILQSWAQQRIAVLNSELAQLTATTGDDEETLVKNATLLLCRLSKLLQVDCYFSINVPDSVKASTSSSLTEQSSGSGSGSGSIPVLKTLYASMYGLLAGKGIGGLREVQPGDELLMLCSEQMWQRVRGTPATPEESLPQCLDWAETLLVGREASPHNYCFPVESFEPLRRLACVEYAMDGFNKLEVKYIQVGGVGWNGGYLYVCLYVCGEVIVVVSCDAVYH